MLNKIQLAFIAVVFASTALFYGCASTVIASDNNNVDNSSINNPPTENVSTETIQAGTVKQEQPSNQTEVKGYNYQNSEKAELMK